MTTHEPPLAPEVAQAKGLRTGWTTGTCASAAAKAATAWLVTGDPPVTVDVALPSGKRVGFPVADVDRSRPHRCAVVKDAGDDPDVTNGAHLTAEVTWLVPSTGRKSSTDETPPAGAAAVGERGGPDASVGPAGARSSVDETPPAGVAVGGEPGGPGASVGPAGMAEATGTGPRSAGTGAELVGHGVAGPAGAGDDPEVGTPVGPGDTGGRATVTVDGVVMAAGEGVGTVTLPGLGLDVGGPAINPVPRRMISAAVREVTDRPVRVTISVPGGEAMAAKTSNDRLGIVGGISILGTTGIVKPFSTASYRASVVQQVDVAAAQGERHMALSTGSRSDRAAQRLLPDLAAVCFVEVGDFTGIALRRAAGAGIERITWVGMAGKIAKLAAGVLMTHYRRSKVDGELLAEVARATGAPTPVVEAATATATARHFAEVCLEHGALEPLAELCRRAARACVAHVDGALTVDVIMVDFAGEEVLARG